MTREFDRNSDKGAEAEAAEWHARLTSDDAAEADWLAFEAWLDRSPAHAAAYRRLEALWVALEDAAPAPAQARRTPARRRPPWLTLAALAASAVLALGVGLAAYQLREPAPAVYQTAKGQTRQVVLADGTRIRLNSGSRLIVRLGRRERRVEMADAEAVFDVAKDPRRPFLVEAGDRTVKVVGTEFDVLRHDGRIAVAVRRGVVEVRLAQSAPGQAPVARLTPGQRLDHREGEAGDRVAATDPEKAFAWTQGRLVWDNARLEDVASDLNRYLPIPVVVAPAARALRLTAVLDLDEEGAMLSRLAGFLPVRAVRAGGAYRLDIRPKQP